MPTQEETDLARQQLTYLLPPEAARARGRRRRRNCASLRKLESSRAAGRTAARTEAHAALPCSRAKTSGGIAGRAAAEPSRCATAAAQQQTQPAPSQLEPVKPAQQNSEPSESGSCLPHRCTINCRKPSNTTAPGGGISSQWQRIPRGPVALAAPECKPGAQILTPTEGVDFSSYIQRLLATLKRNWYAVMPQSAMMGDKGMVSTTFQINRDGSIPPPDPLLEQTSGKGRWTMPPCPPSALPIPSSLCRPNSKGRTSACALSSSIICLPITRSESCANQPHASDGRASSGGAGAAGDAAALLEIPGMSDWGAPARRSGPYRQREIGAGHCAGRKARRRNSGLRFHAGLSAFRHRHRESSGLPNSAASRITWWIWSSRAKFLQRAITGARPSTVPE